MTSGPREMAGLPPARDSTFSLQTHSSGGRHEAEKRQRAEKRRLVPMPVIPVPIPVPEKAYCQIKGWIKAISLQLGSTTKGPIISSDKTRYTDERPYIAERWL